MSKKKIYTFRVTHPKAARLWGLGQDWAKVIDEAIALRIGEVRG